MPIFYKIHFLLLILPIVFAVNAISVPVLELVSQLFTPTFRESFSTTIRQLMSWRVVFSNVWPLLTQVSLPSKPVNPVHVNRSRSVCGYYKVLYCTLEMGTLLFPPTQFILKTSIIVSRTKIIRNVNT